MNPVPTNLEFHPDTWERTFFWEEEPVLLCSLTLPAFDRPSTGAGRRISRYYLHLSRWLRSLWEHQVFPAACAALQAARDASLPFHPYREAITVQVTRNSGGLFSLYWDSYWYTGGAHGMTARWGDTWDLSTGCPMSLSDFFPPPHGDQASPARAGRTSGRGGHGRRDFSLCPRLSRASPDPIRRQTVLLRRPNAVLFLSPLLHRPVCRGHPRLFRPIGRRFCLSLTRSTGNGGEIFPFYFCKSIATSVQIS